MNLVAALGHPEALAWDGQWADVDVVVVDAADEHRSGDQFPGVAVVRHIREATPERSPLVVVVTGHSLHDGLRHRMATARADLFFHRSDLSTAGDLLEAVLHPERWRRGVPEVTDPERRRSLGIREDADVDRLVSYVEEHGLEDALDPDRAVRDEPRSRRWRRHRVEMSRGTGIEPLNMTTGNRPREWDAPSIRQLSRIWAWAARITRPRG